ncbi:transposase, partial [Shewanella algae]|uniref:transposase n=1 Tax=Shewanella algae TaxID=38313 RepID=UPI0021B38B60
MPKPRYKTTNWTQYNKALINRGSLTFWVDEEAIAEWKQNKQGKRGRPRQFSDLAITTALMVKRIFSMPLRALIRPDSFGHHAKRVKSFNEVNND